MKGKKICKHKYIHTERLLAGEMKSISDPHPGYVIESYCADCGLWLKTVDVKYPSMLERLI